MNDITIIICTKNSEETIKQCLDSVKDYKVILIDKDSIDKTIDIASQYKNVTIVSQIGNGLANARNTGLQHVNTEYVMNLGSDNTICKKYDIDYAIEILETIDKLVGIGFKTKIESKKILDKCLNAWFDKKIKIGYRKVIGTPNIYKTEILKKYEYNENCTHSDDTDIGERIYKDNYMQLIISAYSYDIMTNNFSNIIDRWTRYGISDKEYHKIYCKTFKSKLKSYLHTLTTDWIGLKYLPFYILITIIRIKGRLK